MVRPVAAENKVVEKKVVKNEGKIHVFMKNELKKVENEVKPINKPEVLPQKPAVNNIKPVVMNYFTIKC